MRLGQTVHNRGTESMSARHVADHQTMDQSTGVVMSELNHCV